MHHPLAATALLALTGWLPHAHAQTLVQNVNQVPDAIDPDSDPFGFIGFGSEVIFTALSQPVGSESWVTDGTEAGTRVFADLFPGVGSGQPREWTERAPGDWIVTVTGPGQGREVWRSDGTAQGTHLVKDILIGPESSNPSYLEAHQGEVYFYANALNQPRALWKTDGTEAGTVVVSDFSIGAGPTFSNGTEDLLSTPLGLFFTTHFSGGWRLWLTDGTPGNEVLLREEADGDWPNALFEFNGQLYFEAGSSQFGTELWTSDGTPAGTQVVVDLIPGIADSRPQAFTEFSGEVYFSALTSTGGRELFRTDGTELGTVQMTTDPNPGPFSGGTDPEGMLVINGVLVFSASDPTVGRELFYTTGVPNQTTLLADLHPGFPSSTPTQLTAVGNRLVCRASTVETGTELFVTDGTPEGSGLLVDINPAPAQSGQPVSIVSFGGVAYFSANDGDVGDELWITDGTPEGTQLLANINAPKIDKGSLPRDAISLGSRALYSLEDGTVGVEPYVVGPGPQAVELVADFNPGGAGSVGSNEFGWRGYAYLSLFEPTTGRELWRSDGTPGGTFLIADIEPGAGSGGPLFLGVYNGELYFAATTSALGTELYATDGTTEGTRLVADIWSGAGGSVPLSFAVVGDLAYFSAFTPQSGRELWVTDGSAAGTRLVVDLWTGPNGAFFSPQLVPFDGRLYFSATVDGFSNFELYSSDGTEAGTQAVASTNPGGPSTPFGLQVVNGHLLYTALVVPTSRQLFSLASDTGIPVQLTDVGLAGGGSGLQGAVQGVDDVAFLLYDEAGVGNQIVLRTDGTPGGTFDVVVIDPTGDFSAGLPLDDATTTDGRLLLTASDGLFGQELWVTDGTASGTARLTDINPGGGDARPDALIRVGSRFFFAADDGAFGRELHSIPVAATGGWIAEPFGEGCPGANGIPQLGFSGEARIGSPFTLELTDAAPTSVAFLALGLSGRATDLGAGCTALVENPSFISGLPTDAVGALSLPFAIPAEPALIGLNVWSQLVIADPLGALGGASLTAALELVIGG
ncbi:MAG: hypothetical protein AAFZ65_06565 [Planctomycetota bacterium]